MKQSAHRRYPSEIIQGKLYLGEWDHALDARLLEELRVGAVVTIHNNPERVKLPARIAHHRIQLADVRSGVYSILAYRLSVRPFLRSGGSAAGLGTIKPLSALPSNLFLLLLSQVDSELILAHFAPACAFIASHLRETLRPLPASTSAAAAEKNPILEVPVLVHCGAGVSRSSALAIAYLMASRGLAPAEAGRDVLARRSCALPNPGFWRQLGEYGESIGVGGVNGSFVEEVVSGHGGGVGAGPVGKEEAAVAHAAVRDAFRAGPLFLFESLNLN